MLPAAHGLLSDRKKCALVAITTWDVVSYMLYVSKCRYIPNGCEVDIRIPESFPEESLKEFILAFAKVSILELNLICKEFVFTNSAVITPTQSETGSNLVSVTCGDDWTYEQSYSRFQQFDLVRNRMGGWSNFFVAMFTEHQKQHQRRPLFRPHKEWWSLLVY